ncbi:hypothetical protein F4781DRAFT_79040 [Annulohypoxylon bovei var. microspora]|nr:hypothetical protein F4781DRAFT_79040 [Annulohypoxylon bovei var. microspora]
MCFLCLAPYLPISFLVRQGEAQRTFLSLLLSLLPAAKHVVATREKEKNMAAVIKRTRNYHRSRVLHPNATKALSSHSSNFPPRYLPTLLRLPRMGGDGGGGGGGVRIRRGPTCLCIWLGKRKPCRAHSAEVFLPARFGTWRFRIGRSLGRQDEGRQAGQPHVVPGA